MLNHSLWLLGETMKLVMNRLTKTLVTIVLIVAFILLFALVVGINSQSGNRTPGILGLILLAGLYGALKAVWKKKGDNNDNRPNDGSVLQG